MHRGKDLSGVFYKEKKQGVRLYKNYCRDGPSHRKEL